MGNKSLTNININPEINIGWQVKYTAISLVSYNCTENVTMFLKFKKKKKVKALSAAIR